jgi:hypothetical protein
MTPLEIKIAYLTKGIRFVDTARRLKVSNGLVSRVISRLAWSMPVARAISEDISRPFEEVFPERVECLDRRRLLSGCGR